MFGTTELFLLFITLVITAQSLKYLIRGTSLDYERFLVRTIFPQENFEAFSATRLGFLGAVVAIATGTRDTSLGTSLCMSRDGRHIE